MTTEIRPSNIDASGHLFNAFDSNEREVSAGWLVRFCQERGGDDWRPYDHADLLAYYQAGRLIGINKALVRSNERNKAILDRDQARIDAGVSLVLRHNYTPRPLATECNETFRYNGLTTGARGHDNPWIVKGDDDLMHFTPDFVKACFKSRPVADYPGTERLPEKLGATG